MQYTVESQHKHDCYYCHHALLPSWCWACPIAGKESVGWNELKPLALFKVQFVCCSLFILYVGSATYTLPPTALASSASLCDELSFQQLWLLPIFFPELQKPYAYLLWVFFHCGGVLVGHSNTLPSSFLLLFIAQQSAQPPARHVTVNTMECRSCFRPIKWLAYPWFQANSNNSWKRTQTTLLFTSILVIFIFLFCVFWVLGFFVCFFLSCFGLTKNKPTEMQ